MELAKRFVDVGIFTNRLDEMRAFYGERIRLPYEEMLPVGAGVRQYRFGLLGSVVKINHVRDPIPARVAGGYRKLSISDPRTPMPLPMQDPDGNEVELAPSGSTASIRSKSISASPTRPPSRISTPTRYRRRELARAASSWARRLSASGTIPRRCAQRNHRRPARRTRSRQCARWGCVTSRCRCATATESIDGSCRWVFGKARRR